MHSENECNTPDTFSVSRLPKKKNPKQNQNKKKRETINLATGVITIWNYSNYLLR